MYQFVIQWAIFEKSDEVVTYKVFDQSKMEQNPWEANSS